MKESNAIILGYISLIIIMTIIEGAKGFVGALFYGLFFAPIYLIVSLCEKQEKRKEPQQ